MSKYQYTSDLRQSVNKIIQDAYKKTLEKEYSLRTNLNELFSKISHELKWFATQHNMEFYSVAFTDDTMMLELRVNYGSLLTTVLYRQDKLFVTIYSTLDDRLVELLKVIENCYGEPLTNEIEVHLLKQDNQKLTEENISLRKKIEALSGQGLKDKLKDILHNIETLEANDGKENSN